MGSDRLLHGARLGHVRLDRRTDANVTTPLGAQFDTEASADVRDALVSTS